MMQQFRHGYALFVGVGQTQYQPWSLPVTVKDAIALYSVFTNEALCAYPKTAEHVRLFCNEQASYDEIFSALHWLKDCAAADPEATVVIYYSGHGWLDETNNSYYLIQHDAGLNIEASAIAASDFTQMLGEIRAKRLLVFIDSCHAAGMATAKDGKTFRDLPKGFRSEAPPQELFAPLKQGEGRVVFSSSTGSQSSWIRSDGTMSLYTYHLLEALQGAGNQPGDTLVHISDLMGYLDKKVRESARQLNKVQDPYFEFATVNFPVALVRGGKGLPAAGWQGEAEGEAREQIQRIVNIYGNRNLVLDQMSGGTIIMGDQHTHQK